MQMMIALACGSHAHDTRRSRDRSHHQCGPRLKPATTGSLESGKCADLLILDMPDYREIPYHFGMNLVQLVMQNGTVLLERSEVKWPSL